MQKRLKLRRHQTPKPMRRNDGRGFYLCADKGCMETALKRKAFNRVCRQNIDTEEIKRVIGQALDNFQGGTDAKES